MGEYANYQGQQVKIGTCEDMYYLRADQAHMVTPLPGSVDPIKDRDEIRFRFPWPDEDDREPGTYGDHDRMVALHGMTPPESLTDEHYSIQFSAHVGYLVSLPCPESGKMPDGIKVHRNGFQGAVRLCQQRYWDGMLVSVVQCACGLRYRLETLEMAQPAIDAMIYEAERREHDARIGPHNYTEAEIAYQGEWYRKVAERIRAGYGVALLDEAAAR